MGTEEMGADILHRAMPQVEGEDDRATHARRGGRQNGAYPIAPQFYLRAQMNFLWARSNNTFETTYAYNYRTANYLMGFSYEY